MSESSTGDPLRHEREEQEVREALLGDAAERSTAWLFEQVGDIGTARHREPLA